MQKQVILVVHFRLSMMCASPRPACIPLGGTRRAVCSTCCSSDDHVSCLSPDSAVISKQYALDYILSNYNENTSMMWSSITSSRAHRESRKKHIDYELRAHLFILTSLTVQYGICASCQTKTKDLITVVILLVWSIDTDTEVLALRWSQDSECDAKLAEVSTCYSLIEGLW